MIKWESEAGSVQLYIAGQTTWKWKHLVNFSLLLVWLASFWCFWSFQRQRAIISLAWTDLPSFPQLPWNSRIFVCYHAWSDFLPAFLNLTCRGFFLWGNYSHFFSFAQCSMHSFANASTQKSWEVLKMCVSIACQKETKSWETPETEERYFLPFGKEERR